MILDEKITVYEVTADEYGDVSESAGTDIPCSVDAEYGWADGGYEETNPSTLTVSILPNNPFYLAHAGRLYGLLAKYTNELGNDDDRMWYRIVSVVPGKSIYTGKKHLVELTLERVSRAS